MAAFDVCILPNRVNTYTMGNDPIKLYDYLASGRPIVATPVAGVEQFGELLEVADTPERFFAALERVLAFDTDARQR